MKKFAQVIFDGSSSSREKVYLYRVDIEGLKVGDNVVVEARDSFSVAQFVSYTNRNNLSPNVPLKWIVQKVDEEGLEKRKQQQQKIEEIKAKMDERRKQLEEIKIYEILSKDDEEMNALLDQYKKLNA